MASEGSKPVRLKITDLLISRDGAIPTKDSRLTNCFIEDINGSPQVLKRPGFALSTSVATGMGRGFTVVKDPVTGNQISYAVVGNTLYGVGTSYGLGAAIVLLHFDGTDGATTTTDMYNNTVTLTAAELDTAAQKFGTASMKLTSTSGNGNITGLTLPASAWTIEYWIRYPDTTALSYSITEVDAADAIWLRASPSALIISLGHTVAADIVNSSSVAITIAANTWYHVALVWDGSKYYTYFDGVKKHDITSSLNVKSFTNMRIGGTAGAAKNGMWFDECRVSSVCRYPGGTTFTPPTSQFSPVTP